MLSYSEYQRLTSPDPTRAISTHTRILIADDDPDTLELLVLAIYGQGIETYVASDGIELLGIIAECGPFDLIVTDINMPWMEGLQVLASIREAGLDTPVLVVTGLDRPDLPATVAGFGSTMLLRKPFEIDDVRRAIAILIGRAL
jgi:two-component system cell cycle response regulator CtrA